MSIRDFDGEEWVSADAMDRQFQLRQAAEKQRDRLLEATQALKEETGLSPYFSSPPARKERLAKLYDVAAAIESEVGK